MQDCCIIECWFVPDITTGPAGAPGKPGVHQQDGEGADCQVRASRQSPDHGEKSR